MKQVHLIYFTIKQMLFPAPQTVYTYFNAWMLLNTYVCSGVYWRARLLFRFPQRVRTTCLAQDLGVMPNLEPSCPFHLGIYQSWSKSRSMDVQRGENGDGAITQITRTNAHGLRVIGWIPTWTTYSATSPSALASWKNGTTLLRVEMPD